MEPNTQKQLLILDNLLNRMNNPGLSQDLDICAYLKNGYRFNQSESDLMIRFLYRTLSLIEPSPIQSLINVTSYRITNKGKAILLKYDNFYKYLVAEKHRLY
jgi:hypothetical protein